MMPLRLYSELSVDVAGHGWFMLMFCIGTECRFRWVR
jgi:hypothetical protein